MFYRIGGQAGRQAKVKVKVKGGWEKGWTVQFIAWGGARGGRGSVPVFRRRSNIV